MQAVYGYVWMGISLVLFLLMMSGVYMRGLFAARPVIVLVLATAAGWWLRVETYLLLLRILPFGALHGLFLLGATIFGTLLLIAYIFFTLAVINLVFPRTLSAGDIACLAGFSGFGMTLVGMIYGVGKVAVKVLGIG